MREPGRVAVSTPQKRERKILTWVYPKWYAVEKPKKGVAIEHGRCTVKEKMGQGTHCPHRHQIPEEDRSRRDRFSGREKQTRHHLRRPPCVHGGTSVWLRKETIMENKTTLYGAIKREAAARDEIPVLLANHPDMEEFSDLWLRYPCVLGKGQR